MEKKFIAIFLLFAFVAGCATGTPIVWMEKGVSLTEYKVFDMLPVSNETGKTFEFDVADTITQHIKSKLKEKGFIIAEETSTAENIITIKSSLTSYEPGSAFQRWLLPGAGKTQCIVKSTLIDKRTEKVLGEIVANRVVSAGGFYTIGAAKTILETVATDIADEIAKRVKGE
jgi:hypothetical protein